MLNADSARDLLSGQGSASAMNLRLGTKVHNLQTKRCLVAVVNLSPDSPYVDSVADSPRAARRLARMSIDSGADVIELGIESTAPGTRKLEALEQVRALMPTLDQCLDLDAEIAVETRHVL